MHRSPSLRKTEAMHFRITKAQKDFLEIQARKVGISIYEYMRRASMGGRVKKDPTLPAEVLAFRAQLHHLCGILQPFSIKRLNGDELNALERAEIKQLIHTVDEMARQIKTYLQ